MSDQPPRYAFLDLARTLAVGWMVFAHVNDTLLAPSAWESRLGTWYGMTRGLTAPLFLLVSGVAFAVATVPAFLRVRGPSGAFQRGVLLRRRMGRVGLLLLWGGLLTLPWWAEGFPFATAWSVWIPFFSLGVLQCIGLSMALATLLLWAVRSAAGFSLLAGASALLSLALAPSAHRWAGSWPLFPQSLFHAGTFSGAFPLLPWAGFFLSGAALGAWVLRPKADQPTFPGVKAFAGAFLALGAVAWVTGWLLDPWMKLAIPSLSPALALLRLGKLSVFLGLLTALTGRWRPPDFVRLVGRHALTFYVGHMVALYGMPFFPGLQLRVGPNLDFEGTAMVTSLTLLLLWVSVFGANALTKSSTGLSTAPS